MRSRWTLMRGLKTIVACSMLLLIVAAGIRAYTAYTAYQSASDNVVALERLAEQLGPVPTSADLAQAEGRLSDLQIQLDRLDRATALPFGTGRVVGHVPWIGPRYEAGRQLLAVGQLLAGSGASGVVVGRQALASFEQSGMSSSWPRTSPTWLDTVTAEQPTLDRIAVQISQAQSIRSQMDDSVLPSGLQSRVHKLDAALQHYDVPSFVSNDLPAISRSLGSEHPVRYLVMFQNPAELRPGGGFPGTSALVTIDRGQLVSYEFFDSHRLTQAYMDQRTEKVPMPWPIQQYFPQDGFLLHDATWYADFPRGGAEVMAMYAETDWPSIDGVIAVEPSIVSDLLKVAGPVDVTVRGEAITVTSDNVYQELERQQRLWRDGTTHKEMLSSIGKVMIERFASGDSSTLKAVGSAMTAAANRRDVQVYASDPAVQQVLDEKHWTGRLVPDENVQTFALTFANVAVNKASLLMQPSVSMTLSPMRDGRRDVKITIDMRHTGTNDDDPFYSGYQHWWVDLTLPSGSVLESTQPSPMPDPESPSGGSYAIDLFPGQTGQIQIQYSTPASDTLLLRRQPGVTTVAVDIANEGCSGKQHIDLTRDVLVALDQVCAVP